MNIQRFIQARKDKNLSQSELAEGICTQATLSRFENNGNIPSLKILIKLCERLELPMSELFPKVGIKNSMINKELERAEFSLIISEIEKGARILEDIDLSQINEAHLFLRYYYIAANLAIQQDKPASEIRYLLDQILLTDVDDQQNIFHLLAYTGSGSLYQKLGDLDKAEFYFAKVLEKVYQIEADSTETIWRLMHIIYHTSHFYAAYGELEVSDALAHYGISICSDNHVTYYLARVAIQLMENAIQLAKPSEEILSLLYDARAYSKINRNTVALKKLAQVEEELLG